jgi:hypothetical protein
VDACRPHFEGRYRSAYCTAYVWAGTVIVTSFNAVQLCPESANRAAATIKTLPSFGKFRPIVKFGFVPDLKVFGKPSAASMSSDRAILLISDRPVTGVMLTYQIRASGAVLCVTEWFGDTASPARACPVLIQSTANSAETADVEHRPSLARGAS